MLLPIKWLNDYIKIDLSPKKLGELLMFKSFEVESIKESKGFEHIVIGKILEIKKHPNADRLKIVKVDIGTEKIEVVCGGINLREGMLVAFAKIGAKVRWHGEGEFVELKPAEIRGVKSMGMICSASEIGLEKRFPHSEREILDLTFTKAKVGTALADIFSGNEVVFDLSITPNRSDCLSIIGLAREISALINKKVKLPQIKFKESKTKASEFLEVKVENKKLCPQYFARVIRGVKVAPSPQWLQERLESMGLRSINNVVDVTNFVLFEMGQPLHAFDAEKIRNSYPHLSGQEKSKIGGKSKISIYVRNAKKGEKILALDNKEYNLDESDLVITDGKKPIAIAGIIGGEETSVGKETRDIILESAIFDSKSIRLTSRRLGLRTESSYRFERGFSPSITEEALNRAADLIVELGGGEILRGVVRGGKIKIKKKVIKISTDEINNAIGVKIPDAKIIKTLKSLNCIVKKVGKNLKIIPPSYRLDINLPADVIEEVIRVYGYNELPIKYLIGELFPPQKNKLLEAERLVRKELLKMGFDEVYNSSFYGEKELEWLKETLNFRVNSRISATVSMPSSERSDLNSGVQSSQAFIEIDNPISPEEKYFRCSLLPGIFKNIVLNENNFEEMRIFEIGNVYLNGEEEMHVAGVISLKDSPQNVCRQIKGVVEGLFVELDIKESDTYSALYIGVLKDLTMFKNPVGYFEFSLNKITQNISKKVFKPLPKFPGVTRDLSVIVPKEVKWSQIEEIVKKEAKDLFESIELFDIYKDSLAFHINFLHPERTLKSEEIDTIISRVINELETKLGIIVRTK